MKIANPIIPKTTEGTAAKLLIFTSINSVIRFFLAISSKYTAVATPRGNAISKHTDKVNIDPIKAPLIPAISGLPEALPLKT